MTDREQIGTDDRAAARSPAILPSILVVEDNRPNRILMEALLGGLGCDTVLVRGGAEALEVAGTKTFDMILMDIHMPRMDGLETMRRLRASGGPNTQTPVIALTANVHAKDHEAFTAEGVAAILVKPVTAATLAGAINQWACPNAPCDRSHA